MWPCVSRLQIMVGVSGPCHGKTLGCLLLVQQRVEPLGEGRDEISKLVEEVETVKQKMKKEGDQSTSMEMAKEVISNILADPLSPVYKKADNDQGKEMDRLENMVMELKVTVNR